MYANQVLHKHYFVKPIEDNQVVIFELILSTKKPNRFDVESNAPITNIPVAMVLEGKALFPDKKEGRKVTIGNVIGEEHKVDEKSQPYTVFTTESVVFEKGRFTCNSTMQGTYQFLMRHPLNESNPFRDKTKKAVFRIYDAGEVVRENMAKLDLKDTAVDIVKMASHTDLLALASNLPASLKSSVDTTKDITSIKFDLRQLITAGHEVTIIKCSGDKKARLKIQILECENYRFIARDTARRRWVFVNDNEEITKDIPISEDMLEHLVIQVLTGKMQKFYDQMSAFLTDIKS